MMGRGTTSRPSVQRDRATTLNDVAAHAGVSPMTVSRVINGESNVREETRERVMESVAALDYKPNFSARALAGARSYKAALLYANPSAFYLSELLVGSLEEISKHGHQLLVHKISERATEAQIAKSLRSMIGVYDGVIVPPPLGDSAKVRAFLNEHDIPAVFLSGKEGNGRSRKICIDDYEAAKEITQHLISLGHEKIGFIKGNPNQFSSKERMRGYKDALAEAGISYEKSRTAPGLFTYDSGVKAARALLDLDDRPTAIFACNDDMAAATLAVAASRGLPVPGDLSVAGFDDSPLASAVFPRLTTVKQPLSDMAAQAVRTLIDLVSDGAADSDDISRTVTMQYRVVRGNSTGKAL